MKNKIFIIAEIGVNHNGKVTIAKKLINKLSKLDINAVKTQAYSAETLASTNSELANYQSNNTHGFKNQYEMLKEYELSEKELINLSNYSKKVGISFFTSVFAITDFKKLKKLSNQYIKIPSGEFSNHDLVDYAIDNYKEIILSTGLSNMDEIEKIIKRIKKKRKNLNNISILHCTSSYPCPVEDVDISSISTIKNKYKVKTGFSDHTINNTASVMAVSQGAEIIEKHVTLDKNMEGPDHKASQNIEEFTNFVYEIRTAEKMMGLGYKEIQKSAMENRDIVKKSIYASENIEVGERFSSSNLTFLRPSVGIKPEEVSKLIGKKSKNNYKKDDKISPSELF